ncbi:MAG: PIN domain-containing protein [Aliidongia sp.]
MILAAIDTNILVYAAESGGDRVKHDTATRLLRGLAGSGRGLLPLQALSEFYAVALRKRTVLPEDAAAFMRVLAEMLPVREAVLADVNGRRPYPSRDHGVRILGRPYLVGRAARRKRAMY